jgi:hypothetical protein
MSTGILHQVLPRVRLSLRSCALSQKLVNEFQYKFTSSNIYNRLFHEFDFIRYRFPVAAASHKQTKPLALQPWREQAAVNTVPEPKLVRKRSRWLASRPNTRIRNILIQQPEPSGSEVGEYHGWETGCGKFVRQSISLMLCRVLSHAVNLRHGTDGFISPPKEVRATGFYQPSSAGPEPVTESPMGPVVSTLTTGPPRATFA